MNKEKLKKTFQNLDECIPPPWGDRVAAAPAVKKGNELTMFLKIVEPSVPQVLLGHNFVH